MALGEQQQQQQQSLAFPSSLAANQQLAQMQQKQFQRMKEEQQENQQDQRNNELLQLQLQLPQHLMEGMVPNLLLQSIPATLASLGSGAIDLTQTQPKVQIEGNGNGTLMDNGQAQQQGNMNRNTAVGNGNGMQQQNTELTAIAQQVNKEEGQVLLPKSPQQQQQQTAMPPTLFLNDGGPTTAFNSQQQYQQPCAPLCQPECTPACNQLYTEERRLDPRRLYRDAAAGQYQGMQYPQQQRQMPMSGLRNEVEEMMAMMNRNAKQQQHFKQPLRNLGELPSMFKQQKHHHSTLLPPHIILPLDDDGDDLLMELWNETTMPMPPPMTTTKTTAKTASMDDVNSEDHKHLPLDQAEMDDGANNTNMKFLLTPQNETGQSECVLQRIKRERESGRKSFCCYFTRGSTAKGKNGRKGKSTANGGDRKIAALNANNEKRQQQIAAVKPLTGAKSWKAKLDGSRNGKKSGDGAEEFFKRRMKLAGNGRENRLPTPATAASKANANGWQTNSTVLGKAASSSNFGGNGELVSATTTTTTTINGNGSSSNHRAQQQPKLWWWSQR